ncbi:MAG: deoxyribodipyrimidine photo-lyase [Calditrichaceae bacterium]
MGNFNSKIMSEFEAIKEPVNIYWFRRDIRLEDNCGLYHALHTGTPVLPIFIFDTNILDELNNKSDARITFIYNELLKIQKKLQRTDAGLLLLTGKPDEIWKDLVGKIKIKSVFCNHDYEPYAIKRDQQVAKILKSANIRFITFKDQVIFEKDEILTKSGKPYAIFTPYKRRWLEKIQSGTIKNYSSEKLLSSMVKIQNPHFPPLEEIGFKHSSITFPDRNPDFQIIKNYHLYRDFPAREATTRVGIHLRFGTVSIRSLVEIGLNLNEVWLSELIWREFFMMVLWQYPHVVNKSFKSQYDSIKWRNDPDEFRLWCEGKTGYPLVDAGMRELNETGFMHNRVRMVTAAFLTKHLLIDWRWGERYFAEKLLDFELSSNNGNWQWAAGCGCDAAPYFRIFNPEIQLKKFDPEKLYIKKWSPEYKQNEYLEPIISHKYARDRALSVYKSALKKD